MESKLISKRKEALKEINRPSLRQRKKPTKPNSTVIPKIELPIDNYTDYDPTDYTDEYDSFSPHKFDFIKSDEDEFFINELKKKSVISDKLPFELGTKICPADDNAVKKLREQLNKWRQSHVDTHPASPSTHEDCGKASQQGTLIREEPERDSPLRSNADTETKSVSISNNRSYPLDYYLKSESENHTIPEKKVDRNKNGLIILQTKAAALTKEAENQLEAALIKPPKSSQKQFQPNLSDSGESGKTEELVDALFYETTFNKGLCYQCLNYNKQLISENRKICKLACNAESQYQIGLAQTTNHRTCDHRAAINQRHDGKKLTLDQLKTSEITSPCKDYFHNFEQLTSFHRSPRSQNLNRDEETVKLMPPSNMNKENGIQRKKPTVHWSSNLEKEYIKLSHEMSSSLNKSKIILDQKKTHDASVNTEVPKPNASFIHIRGRDIEQETSVKKVFQIQELPGVNIRPQLIKQTCPSINIISKEIPKKQQNIAVIKVVHEKSSELDNSSSKACNYIDSREQMPIRKTDRRMKTKFKVTTAPLVQKEKVIRRDNDVPRVTSELVAREVNKSLFIEKENLLKTTKILKENPALRNVSFKQSLKTLESRVNDLYKYHLNVYEKKRTTSCSKLTQITELPNRLNMVAQLLQDELQNTGTKTDEHYESFTTILYLLSEDIKQVLDEYKRNNSPDVSYPECVENSKHNSDSNSTNTKEHQPKIKTAVNAQYIPYRRLYPGRGALNAIEAATNESEIDLRLTRIKKFYEINQELYKIKSPSPIDNGTNSIDEGIIENEQAGISSKVPLNETFVVAKHQSLYLSSFDHSNSEKITEVDYEDDWEEADESDDEKSSLKDAYEGINLPEEVERVGNMNDESQNHQNEPVFTEVMLESQKHPNLTKFVNVGVNAKDLSLVKSNENICKINEKENELENQYIDKGKHPNSRELFDVNTGNVNASHPFFKLSNPQTNSLVEIRFPQDHNTFKSSITVSSCANNDEIKLCYDKGEQIASMDIKQGELKSIDNMPKEYIQSSIAGTSSCHNVSPEEKISSNFMEFLELKIRDIFNNYKIPKVVIQNKEIQTSVHELDTIASSHMSNEKIDEVNDRIQINLLPLYQSEANSLKTSCQNDNIASDKGTLTDLEIPNLVLNVPRDTSDSNLNSNYSRSDVLPSTVVEGNIYEEEKYENDEVNFVNFSESNDTLQEKEVDVNNFRRLLPLPEAVINDGKYQRNSDPISDQEEELINKQSRENISTPEEEKGETASQIEHSFMTKKSIRLLPLPPVINADKPEAPSVSANTLLKYGLIRPKSKASNELPTDLMPSPSVLNNFIQNNQKELNKEKTISQQDIVHESDEEDSIISCRNFRICYYNSEEMSDGEIGFVYTSNTYSSGEVKPRDEVSENTSSYGNSMSEDGNSFVLTNIKEEKTRLPLTSQQNMPSSYQLSLLNSYKEAGTSGITTKNRNNSSEADNFYPLRIMDDALGRNISTESSTTTESTTTETS